MCSEVVAQIERAFHHGLISSISPELIAHIAGCSSCRGALLLMAASLDMAPPDTLPRLTCAMAQPALAPYIELERADPAAAAQAFPSLWWHLWSCPDCAEAYRLTHLMLDAAAAGEIPPLPGAA